MANLASLLVRGVSRLGQVFASTVKADSFIGTVTKTEFIRGTQTAATGTWTGVTEDAELYDGKEILYFLPYAGSGNATLNLTLSGGTTTGAKNIYFQSTTRCTTHYGANNLIRMTYHTALNIGGTNYEGWWTEPGRDTNSNTYWQLRYYAAVKASTAVTANHVIVGTNAGYVNAAANVAFDITYPILWAGSAITAGSTNDNTYQMYQSVNLATSKSGWTGTQYSEVYMTGTLSGKTFTINSTMFTTTQPTAASSTIYIPIGLMLSTTNCIFHPQMRFMQYVNGVFQEVTSAATWAANAANATNATNATNASKVNNLTVQTAVPANAVFTDTHYTTGLITGGSATATANAAVTNNSVFLNVLDNSTVRNSHNIVGTGSVTVNSDANGKITINGTDNNTTYGLSISDHTISLVAGGTTSSVTVPDNNTNNAVTQTISSTTNANYRVLLSATADDTTRTEGARKDKDFYYNPSTNTLTVGTVSGTATKATGDGSGNNIVNTYLTKAAGVTNVAWDNTNKKVTKTINGSTTDVVKVININTTVSVPSSGWTNSSGVYSQTVNVTGITATMEVEPILGLHHADGATQDAWTSQVEAWGAFAGTGWATTGAGTITLSCYEQPAADFTMSVQARYFST